MTTLFKRKSRILVGTIEIVSEVTTDGLQGLDVEFKIERSLSRHPNTCEIKIFNLSASNRAAIRNQRYYPVQVYAGYQERTTLIFSGDLTRAISKQEKSDFITTVEAGDGEQAHVRGRVNKSFPPNTSVDNVFTEVANAVSNIQRDGLAAVGGALRNASNALLSGATDVGGGTVISGSLMRQVDRLAKSTDQEYSIQDGSLQLLRRGQPLSRDAILLTPNTGLLSAPVRDNRGIVTATTLIIPDLLPGRACEFRGGEITGQFRIERVVYKGSTFGEDWDAEIECREL